MLQEPWQSNPDTRIPEEVSSNAPLPRPVNLFTRRELPRLQFQLHLSSQAGEAEAAPPS